MAASPGVFSTVACPLFLPRLPQTPASCLETAYRYTQPSDPASSPGEQTVPLLLTPSRRLLSHAPSSANPSAPTGGEAGGGDGSSASAAVITAQRMEPKLEAAQRQQLIPPHKPGTIAHKEKTQQSAARLPAATTAASLQRAPSCLAGGGEESSRQPAGRPASRPAGRQAGMQAGRPLPARAKCSASQPVGDRYLRLAPDGVCASTPPPPPPPHPSGVTTFARQGSRGGQRPTAEDLVRSSAPTALEPCTARSLEEEWREISIMNPAGIKTASSKQLQAPLQAESAELSQDRTVKSPSPSTTWFRTAYRYTQPSDPASSPGEQTVPLLLTPSRRLLSHAPSSANPSAPTGGEAGGGDGSSASAAVITAQRMEPKLEAAQRQQLMSPLSDLDPDPRKVVPPISADSTENPASVRTRDFLSRRASRLEIRDRGKGIPGKVNDGKASADPGGAVTFHWGSGGGATPFGSRAPSRIYGSRRAPQRPVESAVSWDAGSSKAGPWCPPADR
ncbi:hypothetical protein ISCGN_003693 [Ixodes scapularis]